MEIFRCSKCKFIRDLSGEGAFRYGGRWNSKGVRMIYSASNPSLALLETLVHTVSLIPELDHCLLKIEIKVDSIQLLSISDLPKDWSSSPAPDHLKFIGDQFIKEGKFLLLQIPSVILPMEWNYLINPAHKLFQEMIVHAPVKVQIDQRIKTIKQ